MHRRSRFLPFYEPHWKSCWCSEGLPAPCPSSGDDCERRWGKKKKSETAHVQKRADFPLRLGKNNASLYIYRCSYSNKLCLQQPDGRRQQNRKKKAKVVSEFFHNLVHFIARLSFFSESLILQSPNPVAWKFPRSLCEDLACIDAHLIGEYRPQCMGFE